MYEDTEQMSDGHRRSLSLPSHLGRQSSGQKRRDAPSIWDLQEALRREGHLDAESECTSEPGSEPSSAASTPHGSLGASSGAAFAEQFENAYGGGSWPRVRLLVTVVHEAGHALVALLVGRRLQGIRLHSDTSGVTVSRGRPTGPGMVVMLAAGYLAPAILGLGAALLLADGRALLLLWSLSLLLLLVLLWIRNGFGLLVVVVVLAGTVAVTWYADARTQSALALLLAWLLLLAAPRPLVELLVGGRAGRRGSDPDQLARLTRIPSVLWTLLLLAASVSGLVVGVSTLAPDLLAR